MGGAEDANSAPERGLQRNGRNTGRFALPKAGFELGCQAMLVECIAPVRAGKLLT